MLTTRQHNVANEPILRLQGSPMTESRLLPAHSQGAASGDAGGRLFARRLLLHPLPLPVHVAAVAAPPACCLTAAVVAAATLRRRLHLGSRHHGRARPADCLDAASRVRRLRISVAGPGRLPSRGRLRLSTEGSAASLLRAWPARLAAAASSLPHDVDRSVINSGFTCALKHSHHSTPKPVLATRAGAISLATPHTPRRCGSAACTPCRPVPWPPPS